MDQRIFSEVQRIQPFQSSISVFKAPSSTEAWKGAAKWSLDHLNRIEGSFLTKSMYEEKGGDYLIEHYASNFSY